MQSWQICLSRQFTSSTGCVTWPQVTAFCHLHWSADLHHKFFWFFFFWYHRERQFFTGWSSCNFLYISGPTLSLVRPVMPCLWGGCAWKVRVTLCCCLLLPDGWLWSELELVLVPVQLPGAKINSVNVWGQEFVLCAPTIVLIFIGWRGEKMDNCVVKIKNYIGEKWLVLFFLNKLGSTVNPWFIDSIVMNFLLLSQIVLVLQVCCQEPS